MDIQVEISVVIVSYNACGVIGTCIDSVVDIDDAEKEIFVVDNASTDGSAEFIRTNYPSVNLIAKEKNMGFAAAANLALTSCKGRYIFLLHPDAEFLPSSFRPLISSMDGRPQIGLAGLKIFNPDGTAQESFSSEYPGQKYTRGELSGLNGSLAWVLSAGMVVRTDVMNQVGGFDEAFFIYGGDWDVCLRVRKAGYGIGFIEAATLVHLGGQGERQTSTADSSKRRLVAEYTFYRKHYRPETVEKITRSYLVEAGRRILTLRFLAPFSRDRKGFAEKYARCQAIRHVLKNDILKKDT
jgi:GT2 family glycosyltransferase